MRTVTLLGFLFLCYAIRGTVIMPYSEETQNIIFLIILVCVFMDVIDFMRKKN